MTKHLSLFLLAFSLCCCPLFLAALEAPFASDPAVSPDGNQVCFVFDNDLWIVPFQGGIPRRITRTTALEWNPQWSPDGSLIAFSSNREGQNFIYTIPAVGGEADVVVREGLGLTEWFSDSRHLLCTKYSTRWGLSFYKAALDGSRPVLLAEVASRYATLSPDNKSIVYQQSGYSRREAYKGSGNGELWQLEIATKKYKKLTDTELSELYPRYSQTGSALYYCASDGQNLQLMKATNLNFKKAVKLSSFERFSAREISIARANDRIVFELFDALYRYDPAKPEKDRISKLEIELSEDNWQFTLVREKMQNSFDNYAVSPDELLVGFNYDYDSFFMPRKGGEVKQITFDQSGVNTMQFLDNRRLVLSKMDKGIDKLYIATADSVVKLDQVDWFGKDSLSIENIYKDEKGRWAIEYADYFRHSKIAIADSGLVNIRPLDTPWAVTTNFAFNNSGSKAIYGTVRDDNYVCELYLYDLKTNTNKRIMADDAWLRSLNWTPDGKSLLYTRRGEIYRLDLVPRDEFEYDKDNWQEILAPPKAKADSSKAEEDKDSEAEPDKLKEEKTNEPEPEIVWEGIEKRSYPVMKSEGAYLFVLSVLSDSTFYYVEIPNLPDKNSSLKKLNIYGKNQKEEFSFGKQASNWSWVNKTVYYLDGKQLKSYTPSTASRKEIKGEFDYSYDKKVLNQRVFEQAWGAFGQNFYDPDMHGQNWEQIYELYRPYVDKARSINDIATIITEMIGDVNASHTGFYPRQDERQFSNPPCYLGAELDYYSVLPKGIKLTRVYPTSRLAAYYKITDGALLTHIDGIEITPSTPVDSLLAGKAGKRIKLRFSQNGEAKEAMITGLNGSEAIDLKYAFTTQQSRELVDKLSNGKLGYIHIPSMGSEDWTQFYTELFRDNYDKQALVIDVRGNTGGHIHDQIISLLQKKRYAYSNSRSQSRVERLEPRRAWDKPTIVLVNEDSFSDGEIFPTIYQELKLGKVVGTPSSGAVIGTWHYYLLDGSSMRMPGTGWYKLDGTNMEGNGAKPDIMVENLPEDTIAERDPQLERAVKELLKELK